MKINRFLKSNPFFKNVATLTTGTSIAQGLQLLISPILTRLYTPDEFGLLALFVSIIALLSAITTGKYELAIILPKKEGVARKIVRLSVLILIVSFIVLTFVFFFGQKGILYFISDKRIGVWFVFCTGNGFFFSLHLKCISIIVSGTKHIGLYRNLQLLSRELPLLCHWRLDLEIPVL